ncbi:hypothetical protein EJB00_05245 [Wolbachia endosymbiont of Drosophila mauritiana]|uniref:hypothetical protein n=1 Tax=unclassified Wolbachia TaxID=2640676 RepID=UPI00107E802D|nr:MULTISPECIES: hypothetical protein [unclassified Wolbachia]QCB62949.1 hypothetical protein EJA99_05260 [Wolbachia endosymbiont of Drosophila mauritiana]QCB63994.1 hypothetical protein EJB00_05245 [Wolbachia endosymbiont of Drosophila mauritiana]QWE33742.1 Uncharacterized protein WwMa_08610 [Wolbachia endosymbiont of Drosophila simulans]TGB06186.1 hypothetical protein E5C28_04875 [Wolbachia endosymbiont of Drosophila mauritiana]
MNQVVADGHREVIDLNNNSDGLGKVESIFNVALEEEEEFFDAMEDVSNVEEGNDLGLANSEEGEEFFDAVSQQDWLTKQVAAFNVPLSIFHYKDYNSDFFTSWYNISSRIFKEINRACPEKKVLNLALSVLMLPYIAFVAMGLVIYSRFKADSKTQEGVVEDKAKKSETSVSRRFAYGALAAIAIFVNVTVLVALIVPATIALATFYLLNRELSHSLVAVLKISMGRYSNKHQNIEISFHETEFPEPNITWDMEIKFPPQFKQLLRDLCENENDKWFSVKRGLEHNIILKLSASINLNNGLKPLHNEIKNVIATSIQEFAKTMEELVKLEKEEITRDKLKELLNEFRLKVVSSIGSKLTTHLIENAYQVAFIQAIKFQQNRRGEDFSLEDELKNTLVKQKLESQGKELPNEKEMIIKDLKEAGAKVPNALDNSELPVFKAEWERLIQEGKITRKTIIDVYKDTDLGKTEEVLNDAKEIIKDLKKQGQVRYTGIHEKLKAVYNEGKNNLTNDDLKRKLEGLFKFEYGDQEVERRLVKSVMKKTKGELGLLGMLSLIDQFRDLEEEIKGPLNGESLEEASGKVNDFIAKMYLEITKRKTQDLFKSQAKGIENSCKLLEEKEPDLVQRINVHRVKIAECLDQPISLREVIEESEDLNKYLEDERKRKGEKHPSTKLIEKHLKNNQEILKALKQLELEEKGLLINEKTKNDYREELESREKIKFAIIEDALLKAFEHEIFDEEAIKKLLEEAELEYYLAEKCIKSPVIKMKDNIKHFCQDLLSPLINRLVENIVNNVPKSDKSSWLQPIKAIRTGLGYIQTGLAVAMRGDKSAEGKALSVAHDTHKEVETFLQHFQSSYEEVGVFFGNLFSDDGETFKNDVWPQIEEHLHGMWDRFFKDIEFKIGNKLDEVNVTQQNQETAITA